MGNNSKKTEWAGNGMYADFRGMALLDVIISCTFWGNQSNAGPFLFLLFLFLIFRSKVKGKESCPRRRN